MNNKSGHLFPVKAFAFVTALRALKDEIEKYNKDNMGCRSIGPNDGKIRMVLATPEVILEVRRKLKVEACRVRFAFPTGETSFLYGMPYLEVYDVQGAPLMEPVAAPELEDALANAVQVELLHFLLETRGIDIPML